MTTTNTAAKQRTYTITSAQRKDLERAIEDMRDKLILAIAIVSAVAIGLAIIVGILLAKPTYITTDFESVAVRNDLWTIAEQYVPESMDIRNYLILIAEINDLKSINNIEYGTVIKVPIMELD